MLDVKLIINGVAVSAQDGATFDRVQPVSEEVVSNASSASVKDAQAAANAAAAAFTAWSQTSDEARSEVLLKAAELMMERVGDFIAVVALETGGSGNWTRFNCELAADIFRHAAGLTGYRTEMSRKGRDSGVTSTLLRQPAGVVLGIAPWNAPIVLASRAVAIPLACGNTVVLKASELCPGTHSMVIEILNDAGLPPGAANLVTNAPESAGEIVESLVQHPAVRRVNFTGSTRVGRSVAEICARYLTPVVLELSGKAPLIILDDADMDAAVAAAVFGAFFNSGQVCISTERLIVDEKIADVFIERLAGKASGLTAGDPREGDFSLGSMISANAAVRVDGLVKDAVNKGARLVLGGNVSGSIMQPTILDQVNSSMRIYHEESFGPIAEIIRVQSDDEAISVANNTGYGLASAVFSRNPERANNVAMKLETGICNINGPTVYDDPAMPFGGMKESGYGKLGGEEAVHEFTELRWITVHEGKSAYPI
jgi:vanillin dehydrogenase